MVPIYNLFCHHFQLEATSLEYIKYNIFWALKFIIIYYFSFNHIKSNSARRYMTFFRILRVNYWYHNEFPLTALDFKYINYKCKWLMDDVSNWFGHLCCFLPCVALHITMKKNKNNILCPHAIVYCWSLPLIPPFIFGTSCTLKTVI